MQLDGYFHRVNVIGGPQSNNAVKYQNAGPAYWRSLDGAPSLLLFHPPYNILGNLLKFGVI
jgi:hypothetical protein